jgi:hypothetical protein
VKCRRRSEINGGMNDVFLVSLPPVASGVNLTSLFLGSSFFSSSDRLD